VPNTITPWGGWAQKHMLGTLYLERNKENTIHVWADRLDALRRRKPEGWLRIGSTNHNLWYSRVCETKFCLLHYGLYITPKPTKLIVVAVGELKSLKASDLMVGCLQVSSQTSVADALELMLKNKSHRIIILSDGRLEGIATTYDFVSKIQWGSKPLNAMEVGDIMTRDVLFITPEDDLRHIVDLLFFRGIRFAPVVAEGVVKGIISRRELGRIFAENFGHKYRASDLMSYRYTTSTMHDSLRDFFKKMRVYDDKYIIILSGEEVVGVVTPTDVLNYLHNLEDVNLTKPYHIRNIMTKKPFTAVMSDKCDKLAKTMIERNISGVPIIDKKLEGLIRYTSFLQFLEV